MDIVVQKFGGTSVGSVERIAAVAELVKKSSNKDKIVVVVSAMSGETNKLIDLAKNFTQNPNRREFDALVSTGEKVSSSLLAIALDSIGIKAKSLSASQISMKTTNSYSKARILDIDSSKIKRLVLCSGKFYYDLRDHLEKNNILNTAIVRIEQLFPFPVNEIKQVLNKYSNAGDIVWAQEEPRNMGPWSHMLLHYSEARSLRVASRRFYSSPSAGSSTRSKRRHQEVIEYVFDESKNNMN